MYGNFPWVRGIFLKIYTVTQAFPDHQTDDQAGWGINLLNIGQPLVKDRISIALPIISLLRIQGSPLIW